MTSIEVKDTEVINFLARIKSRIDNMRPAMDDIAGELEDNIEDNFEAEGRYSIVGDYIGGDNKWQKHSPITEKIKEKRGKKKPFMKLQESGRLKDSIETKVEDDSVSIGTNLSYAKQHQFGAQKGEFGFVTIRIDAHLRSNLKHVPEVKGHERKVPDPIADIPARPFLTVHPDSLEEIRGILSDFLLEVEGG